MKINTTFNKNQISDALGINGNELTINGATFPLDNLPKYPTEEDADIQVFLEANPAYTDSQGIAQMDLVVAMNRNHLFINNNFMTMHGIDLNNVSNDDLVKVIDCYNHENDIRIENHRQIITEFCLKSVSGKNQDKAREFYNSRTPGTLRANYTRTLNQFIIDHGIGEGFKAEVMAGYEAWLDHVKTCMAVR